MSYFITCLLLFVIIVTASARLSLTILHVNDVNGRFDEISDDTHGLCLGKEIGKKCIGGAARVADVVNKHREMHKKGLIPRVLFLVTGNVYTGSIWFRIHKHNITRDVINKLRPDVVGIGSREFHYGPEELIPYLEGINSRVPVVCTNIDTGEFNIMQQITKSLVLDVNGIKVGIMGYISTQAKQHANMGNVKFKDVINSLTDEGARLRKQGVMITMAIGNGDLELHHRIAEEVPELNIVIAGESRMLLWNKKMAPKPEPATKIRGPYPVVVQKLLNKALLVTTLGLTRYVGRLNVTWDDNGNLLEYEGQPIFLGSDMPMDNMTAQILEKYKGPVIAAMKKNIGQTKVLLSASHRVCRLTECNFGNIVADAMVDYAMKKFQSQYWTKAPIALITARTTKSDINPFLTNQTITEATLMSAMPFDQPVVMCSLDGNHLRQAIEFSVAAGETAVGDEGFLQYSGLRIIVDRNRPQDSRVLSIRVRCGDCQVPVYTDFDMHGIYNIVTLEKLVTIGAHGHSIFNKYSFDAEHFGVTDYEIIKEYLMDNIPVYPQVEGRITFNDSEKRSLAGRNSIQIVFEIVLIFILISS